MCNDTQAYLMDVKRLKQEHAEMLAFLQNDQNQAKCSSSRCLISLPTVAR